MDLARLLRREWFFFILIAAYALLVAHDSAFLNAGFVEWTTVMIIASFIIVTTGLLLSGGIDFIAARVLKRIGDLRSLAIFSVAFTALVSMFITNDASLIVLVPLTVSMGRISGKPVTRIVILQAIAANVGSMLMPFGNPQNIIIFKEYSLSILAFLHGMLPIFAASFASVLAFAYAFGGSGKITHGEVSVKVSMPLLALASLLFCADVAGMLAGYGIYFFAATALAGLLGLVLLRLPHLSAADALFEVDFFLILTFVLIFLVINSVRSMIGNFSIDSPIELFGYSLVFSQFISNVPAAVLFGTGGNWTALAWGVDVGGNGTIIASLANLIALRKLEGRKVLEFSKISFAFLAVTAAISIALLLAMGY